MRGHQSSAVWHRVATSDFVVNSDLVTRPHARGNGLHRLNLAAPVMGLIVAK